MHGLEAAEPGADHDDMMSVRHPIYPRQPPKAQHMIAAQDGAAGADGDNEILP